jgi:hypothetical protein
MVTAVRSFETSVNNLLEYAGVEALAAVIMKVSIF